jgi:hypothetical protein
MRSCRANNNILSGMSVVQSQLDRLGGSSGEASQSLMWIDLVVLERCQMAWNGVSDSLEAIASTPSMPGWLQSAPSLGFRASEFRLHRNALMTNSDEMVTVPPTTDSTRFLMLLLGPVGEFCRTECSNGRDKIYSLLGFAYRKCNRDNQVAEDLIPMDYEKYTTVDVYRHFASLVLEHLDHLRLLSFVGNEIVGSTPNLPSWVPDFIESFGAWPVPNLAPDNQRPFRVWGQRFANTHRPEVRGNELILWETKVDIIDCGLGPVGGLEKDYKGLKSLTILYPRLPDIRRDPQALVWH